MDITAISAFVIAAFGLILTVLNIIDKSLKLKKEAQRPDEEQNLRISQLESDVISIKNQLLTHDRYFQTDREQIESLKIAMRESNKIIIQSLQSLIAHSIDGNDIEQLKESKRDIEQYLLSK